MQDEAVKRLVYEPVGGRVSLQSSCGQNTKKSVFIDTNFVTEDGIPRIHEMITVALSLKNDEKVLAYQDEECWEAKVVKGNNYWGVQLLTEAKTVNKERLEGQKEGFQEGIFVQMLRMIKVLQSLGYSEEEIERIKRCLEIK